MLFARAKSSASDLGPRLKRRVPVEGRFADYIPADVRAPLEVPRYAKDCSEIIDLLRYIDEPPIEIGTECWIWYGAHDSKGYGVIWQSQDDLENRGRQLLAHRVSWEVFRGRIPKGHVVSQTCERKDCFNPRHLVRGPHGKIIGAKERRNMKTARYGDDNATSKLTDEDVRQIRDLHRQRNFEAIAKIARKRGVCRDHAISVGRTRGRKRKPDYGLAT